MTNPVDAYLERSHRVALLMEWLAAALERHDDRAADFDEPARLWPMVGNLEHVEEELKPLLSFIAAVPECEIDELLNRGGQDNA